MFLCPSDCTTYTGNVSSIYCIWSQFSSDTATTFRFIKLRRLIANHQHNCIPNLLNWQCSCQSLLLILRATCNKYSTPKLLDTKRTFMYFLYSAIWVSEIYLKNILSMPGCVLCTSVKISSVESFTNWHNGIELSIWCNGGAYYFILLNQEKLLHNRYQLKLRVSMGLMTFWQVALTRLTNVYGLILLLVLA